MIDEYNVPKGCIEVYFDDDCIRPCCGCPVYVDLYCGYANDPEHRFTCVSFIAMEIPTEGQAYVRCKELMDQDAPRVERSRYQYNVNTKISGPGSN